MNNPNDLTNEEKAILDSLHNPDASTKLSQYKWDDEVQKEIMGLLINDREFMRQSRDLIKPSYFLNECHQLLAKILFHHFEKYSSLPNRVQLKHEMDAVIGLKDPKVKLYYYSELASILEYYVPGLEARDYYLDKIVNFAKGMAMRQAFAKCLDTYKAAPESEDTWFAISKMLQDAMAVDRDFELGLDYFASFEDRYARMNERVEKCDYFVTGFKDIDDALNGGGLARGEIGSVVGLSGTGKSIFLVNAAIANLHRGKNVLYLSLEIDQDKCAERFDAQFANPEPYGSADNGITTKNLYDHKEEVFSSLRAYTSDKENKQILIVKQFPAGQMDMSTLQAYIAQLKLGGFVPDLVIIDYIGEMKDYPGMPTWESRQRLVRDLRGLAVMEKFCCLTAMQPDARAREQITLGGVIDDENLAESKGQVRPLDALWTLNQRNEEKECGLARLFVSKHRDGKSRFIIHIQFDYKTLKMRQISEAKYTEILKKHQSEKEVTAKDLIQKETKLDAIVKPMKPMPFKNDAGYQDVEEAPPSTDE